MIDHTLAFTAAFPAHRFSSFTSKFSTAPSIPQRLPSICASANTDRKAARRSLRDVDIPSFNDTMKQEASSLHPLTRRGPTTLQVNIGLTCNLACRHCHVESSPSRSETMSHVVAERLVQLAANEPSLRIADITGGAPEMHDEFRYLVSEFSALGLTVIDRCNLTIIHQKGQHDLVDFLATHGVQVVASLPCYSSENVEKQRGNGVFDDSISALQMLNAAGYGKEGSSLELNLVYNPTGASLPPAQAQLEVDYKRELKRAFGIEFSNLICITNMPIKRFADDLLLQGQLEEYMNLLVSSFNPDTVDGVMCRDQVHVAYDGSLYDCDFNYALEMNIPAMSPLRGVDGRRPFSVFDIESLSELTGRRIATGKHCYGCTAGTGSSCGGALM